MHSEQQTALAGLAQAALATNDMPTLLRQAVTLVGRTLQAAHCAVWELLPDGSALVRRAGAGWWADGGDDSTIAIHAAVPLHRTLLGIEPVIVADWRTETRLQLPQLLADRAIACSAYAHIQAQGDPYRLLGVDLTAEQDAGGAELGFLQLSAAVLALAIERIQSRQVRAPADDETARLVTEARNQAVFEERQRLARELHDSVTQALYSVTLHATAATRLLAGGDIASTAGNLHVLRDTAQEALDEMRLLIFDLRPPVLEQVGLADALRARLSAVEGRANLHTQLLVDELPDLPAAVEESLYRIVQEALNNALRHAHAAHVRVRLEQTQGRILLDIADDGVGFDPAAMYAAGGVGLRGIGERVAQLGGTFSLESSPSAGTRLRVEVAL